MAIPTRDRSRSGEPDLTNPHRIASNSLQDDSPTPMVYRASRLNLAGSAKVSAPVPDALFGLWYASAF
jgi:hypothetical protein